MNHKLLTDEEKKFIENNYKEHSPAVIAEIIGRASTTVTRYLRSKGLEIFFEVSKIKNGWYDRKPS